MQSSGPSMEWVARWCATTISLLRQREVFDGNWSITENFSSEDGLWLLEDQIKRIVLVLVRLDGYCSVLTERGPTLRAQELRLPLPNSDAVWDAESSNERASLRWRAATGRSKQLMSSLLREGMLKIGMHQIPTQLSLEDYHLALCLFQGSLWELTMELRQHDQMTTRNASNMIKDELYLWRRYLKDIRNHIELNHNLECTFFGGNSGSLADPNAPFPSFAAPDLTFYHIQSIGVYANMRMLEYHTCCSDCRDSGLESRIRGWVQSEDGRRAVVHAAQLRRVHEREAALLTPLKWRISNTILRPFGVLMSAIVLYAYSVRIEKCGMCGGPSWNTSTSTAAIELLQPEFGLSAEKLDSWILNGGMATLGQVPLCSCSQQTHSEWYLHHLSAYPAYHKRMLKFMTNLLP